MKRCTNRRQRKPYQTKQRIFLWKNFTQKRKRKTLNDEQYTSIPAKNIFLKQPKQLPIEQCRTRNPNL